MVTSENAANLGHKKLAMTLLTFSVYSHMLRNNVFKISILHVNMPIFDKYSKT